MIRESNPGRTSLEVVALTAELIIQIFILFEEEGLGSEEEHQRTGFVLVLRLRKHTNQVLVVHLLEQDHLGLPSLRLSILRLYFHR